MTIKQTIKMNIIEAILHSCVLVLASVYTYYLSCLHSISITIEDVFSKSNSNPQLVQFTHGWQVQFLAQGLTFIPNELGGEAAEQ